MHSSYFGNRKSKITYSASCARVILKIHNSPQKSSGKIGKESRGSIVLAVAMPGASVTHLTFPLPIPSSFCYNTTDLRMVR